MTYSYEPFDTKVCKVCGVRQDIDCFMDEGKVCILCVEDGGARVGSYLEVSIEAFEKEAEEAWKEGGEDDEV